MKASIIKRLKASTPFSWTLWSGASLFLLIFVVVLVGNFDTSDQEVSEDGIKDLRRGHFVSADEGKADPVLPQSGPLQSFATLRYAVRHGGNEEVREAAISWLDERLVKGEKITDEQEKYLVSLLTEGGSPEWDKNYRQHLFNSIFNSLHQRQSSNLLLPVLLRLARKDDDRVMRLYAIQHLRVLIEANQIPAGQHAEVRDALLTFAEDPEGQLSGLALAALASWDQQSGIEDAEVQQDHVLRLARQTATDSSRALDVRVSAIHATGPESLETARALALSEKEHTLIRKAAISRLGRYGGKDDLTLLSQFPGDNFRLQQAIAPAIKNIKLRLSGAQPSTSSRH